MLAEVTVHTTGFNWDGIIANVAGITGVLVVIATLMARAIKSALRDMVDGQVRPLLDSIHDDLTDVKNQITNVTTRVDRHEVAIAKLEGFQEGRAMYQATIEQTRAVAVAAESLRRDQVQKETHEDEMRKPL